MTKNVDNSSNTLFMCFVTLRILQTQITNYFYTAHVHAVKKKKKKWKLALQAQM